MLLSDHLIDRLLESYAHLDGDELLSYLDAINFKYEKSIYHLSNIDSLIAKASQMPFDDDYYSKVLKPISFEAESILVALRSQIDIVLRLAATLWQVEFDPRDVSFSQIQKALRAKTLLIGNALQTLRASDSPNMEFLHRVRNIIAHEADLMSHYPLHLRVSAQDQQQVDITCLVWGQNMPVASLYRSCIAEVGQKIERLVYKLIEEIAIRGE